MGVRIYGATSGYVDIEVPDVADNGTVTLSPSAVSPGLVLIRKQSFSGATSVSLDNVFSSTYKNYKIVWSLTGTGDYGLMARMRASGADNSTANYYYQDLFVSLSSTSPGRYSTQTAMQLQAINTALNSGSADVFGPALARETMVTSFGSRTPTLPATNIISASHAVASAYDGITLYPSTGTFTGDVYVYGYAETVGDYSQLNQVPGLSLITTQSFSAASTVSVDNCFTSTYDNYRVVFSGTGSTTAQQLRVRMRLSGVDDSTAASYKWTYGLGGGSYSGLGSTSDTSGCVGVVINTALNNSVTDFCAPALVSSTAISGVGYRGDAYGVFYGTGHTLATAYDGFTIYPASGTITGTLSVYGYRKA